MNNDFSFLNFGNYNLKGVIKKYVDRGKKIFECIYKVIYNPQNPQNSQWILSDGYNFNYIESHSNDNTGNVVKLFYEKQQTNIKILKI